MRKFLFSQPDNVVLEDTELSHTAYRLYNHLKKHAGKGNTTIIKVKTLAKELGCCPRTVRYALKQLSEKGIVERIARKSPYDPKLNLANRYIIHGRHAKCYAGTELITPPLLQNIAITTAPHCIQEQETLLPELESKESNLTGKPELPIGNSSYVSSATPKAGTETQAEGKNSPKLEAVREQEENSKSKTHSQPEVSAIGEEQKEKISAKGQELDLTGVPDMLRPIARNLLTLSGRTKLEADEIRCLKELLEKHTPNRIEREIESKARYFKERGRNPKCLTAYYIHAVLMGQPATYHPEATGRTPSKRRQKAAKSAAKAHGAQVASAESTSVNEAEYVAVEPATPANELAMPVAEAEQVIAEYESEQKPKAEIPTALQELYEAIRERKGNLTFEDYLRLKFPDAEEDELSINMYAPQRDCEQAYELDMACAMCNSPEECHLPCGCRKGSCRPLISLRKDDWTGKRHLYVGLGGCIKCKHDGAGEQRYSPEVESMIKESGLTQYQSEHTFMTYQSVSDELIAAKAKAILAAKSGRNLILAGKVGTGKTHLATAIAIEAMKQGKKVVFTTLSEMLGVIAQAGKDNTDLFGTKMKYQSVPLLVLDDWDKANMTDARLGYLFDILDYRYNHGLQTIVTTNANDMAGMEFRWYLGKIESLVSRLLENGDMVTILQASNYRLKGHFCTPKREAAVEPAKPAEPKVEPAKSVEPKPEPVEVPEYDEPDDYEEYEEPDEYSYVERQCNRENADSEERDCDGFRSIAEIFGSMRREPEAAEKFTEPATEEEWTELLDDGGFGQYTSEEITELLFGGNPEEYISQPYETQAVSESAGGGNIILTDPKLSYDWDDGEDEIDEADLKLYGGLYTD